MKEQDMRKLLKKPLRSDLSNSIQARYGMGLPRNTKEASPKVEVDVIDVSEEIYEKVKGGR